MGESKEDAIQTSSSLVKPVSRREFLKALGLGGAALFTYGIGAWKIKNVIIPWFKETPEIKINPEVIKKEKKDSLGLGELGKSRVEYFILWPQARAWVLVNNILASEKLNQLPCLEKGKSYSLINLLGLKEDSGINFNPQEGYITGFASLKKPPFLIPIEQQGICLISTVLGRTLAQAPVAIEEWHSHTEINQFTRPYFSSRYQLSGPSIFTNLGTDAALCTQPRLDLRFRPLIKGLKLKVKIMNLKGEEIPLPQASEMLGKYIDSFSMKFTTPILIRMALGGVSLLNYQINLQAIKQREGEKIRPGFVREITQPESGKTIARERFLASYDIQGKYFPQHQS